MSRSKRFTAFEKDFIRDNHPGLSDQDIATKLGRTEKQIKEFRKRNQIGTNPRRPFSKQEEAFMIKHYSDMDMDTLLAGLPGRDKRAVYGAAKRLGLKKSDAFMQKIQAITNKNLVEFGAAYRFPKGNVPVNKGRKGIAYKGPEKTWFKKGQEPKNTKYDGAITIRRSGTDPDKRPEKYIRVAKGKWVQYRRWLWEQHHGLIPAGHVIRSKNGDPINFTIEDLEMITMAENARRNKNDAKAQKSLEAIRDGKKKPRSKITKFQAAKKLAGGDPELARELVKRKPRLVKIQQLNMKIKREVRYGAKSENS